MEKHTPVLLDEVITLFSTISDLDEVFALDCTLGQAGHSIELFKRMKQGVLISIDLDSKTIEWVVNHLSEEFIVESKEKAIRQEVTTYFELHAKNDESKSKKWIIIQFDFSRIQELLTLFDLPYFHFILADLGFSNYQLTQNKGISFDRPNQRLDMRYDQTLSLQSSLNASEVLNTFDENKLAHIFSDLGQIDDAKKLAHDIVQTRNEYPFEKVSDVLRILNKPKYPKGNKYKFFQALRSFVNSENERLLQLLENSQNILSEEGMCCVITFNSIEESIIINKWDKVEVVEPNITELIKNRQSRSAKLYIYKKNTDSVQEKN